MKKHEQNASSKFKKCPLCGQQARMKCANYPGYQKPDSYAIIHCSSCDTSFVDPMAANPQVYDLIYSHVEKVSGYFRYAKYATEVLSRKDPLDYLADMEDIYWAVKKHLDVLANNKKSRKILEIGSGLGYLTYSIVKSGFDIRGLDISEIAVDKARKGYGDYFICGDVIELSKVWGSIYDIVIMTEVIEHIPNIREMFAAVDSLLIKGGEVIITTPNKSAYPDEAIWVSDAPPVHLWWLSETSIRYLASEFGYTVRFVDFSVYNTSHPHNIITKPIIRPTFDSNGDLCIRERFKHILRSSKLIAIAHRLEQIFIKKNTHNQFRRNMLCAVLKKM